MTTALDLITDVLQKIGSYAPGETISDADAELCLRRMNRMLDSWSNESLTCFTILEQSFPLQTGKIAYTIGTTGTPDINATRPIRIITGPGAAYLLDSNNNRYPVAVMPRDKWNEVWNLQSSSSNIPNTLFYDPQFPLGVLNVYPKFNGQATATMYFDSYQQIAGFASLTTSVSLPPGYEIMVIDNLAEQIWRYFKGDNVPIPSDITRDAAVSKGNIKRSNMRENIAEFDKELVTRSQAVYSPYTDSYIR